MAGIGKSEIVVRSLLAHVSCRVAPGVEDVRRSEIGEEAELINRRQQEFGLETNCDPGRLHSINTTEQSPRECNSNY